MTHNAEPGPDPLHEDFRVKDAALSLVCNEYHAFYRVNNIYTKNPDLERRLIIAYIDYKIAQTRRDGFAKVVTNRDINIDLHIRIDEFSLPLLKKVNEGILRRLAGLSDTPVVEENSSVNIITGNGKSQLEATLVSK